ncbi:hypothetical protein C5167_038214 [Papaver somniferum]|uniref:Uncharacterized protein n=1 Tax=Papaver somniferum TaxID=3469 RepID=A0A4Y7IC92_PAPSO|nr:hypothetical protein C5167_038214 [Papaver somniferum]
MSDGFRSRREIDGFDMRIHETKKEERSMVLMMVSTRTGVVTSLVAKKVSIAGT